MPENKLTHTLFEKRFISQSSLEQIREYRSREIFSIRNEVRFLLFLAVTLFTSGVGIFIYNNIDSIGHIAILAIILLVTLYCFYYSYKHAPGFSKQAAPPQQALYDYMVLAAHLLSGIFIAYLQFQYSVFGPYNELATLCATLLYFFGAYYFDHKGVLSLAITGVCALIGFTASPGGLFQNRLYHSEAMCISAMFISLAFILWSNYAESIDLKKHFNLVYKNFAQHIQAIACISLMCYDNWFIPLIVLAAFTFYFVKLAYRMGSLNFLVFAILYGFIGLSIAIVRLMFLIEIESAFMFIYLIPFYIGGVIVFFIRSLKNFKNRSSHDSLR